MTVTSEQSRTAPASLMEMLYPGVDQPAAASVAHHGVHLERPSAPWKRRSRGSTLARSLRGLAARIAAWRERRATIDALSDRDLADIGLSWAPTRGVFQHHPPIWPPPPPRSGRNDPARPMPSRSGLLRPALACSLCALLAIAGVFVLDALGVAPPAPCGEDPVAAFAGP